VPTKGCKYVLQTISLSQAFAHCDLFSELCKFYQR